MSFDEAAGIRPGDEEHHDHQRRQHAGDARSTAGCRSMALEDRATSRSTAWATPPWPNSSALRPVPPNTDSHRKVTRVGTSNHPLPRTPGSSRPRGDFGRRRRRRKATADPPAPVEQRPLSLPVGRAIEVEPEAVARQGLAVAAEPADKRLQKKDRGAGEQHEGEQRAGQHHVELRQPPHPPLQPQHDRDRGGRGDHGHDRPLDRQPHAHRGVRRARRWLICMTPRPSEGGNAQQRADPCTRMSTPWPIGPWIRSPIRG